MDIINYSTAYKDTLLEIALEWLNQYDLLEDVDVDMISHPERMIEAGGHVLLARQDGKIVGMIMLEDQGDVCEILKLGVKESARGMGAGHKLVETAVQIARSAGKKKVVLCSNHKLKAALRLYEESGFQYVEYAKNHFDLSDISMELILQ